MDRKDFLSQVGNGAAALLVPFCIGGISGCTKTDSTTSAPSNVDFKLDVSTGTLAKNGGYLVSNGVIVARTNTGSLIAVSAACTHQGTNVYYNVSGNSFICPNHNANFSADGTVTKGPASTSLTKYNTALIGNSLRVYS